MLLLFDTERIDSAVACIVFTQISSKLVIPELTESWIITK